MNESLCNLPKDFSLSTATITPEGAQEAIRSSLGYLLPSEKRVPMLDMPRATANLPDTWPYTVVANILQVRSAQAIRNSGVEILNPLKP